MLIYMIISVIAGFMLANQSPINSDLRAILKSPFIAASISFVVGTIFLAITSLVMSGRVLPNATFIQTHPAWIWLGGSIRIHLSDFERFVIPQKLVLFKPLFCQSWVKL